MSFWKRMLRNNRQTSVPVEDNRHAFSQTVSCSLQENISGIQAAFFHTDDLKIRPVPVDQLQGQLLYLESMCDEDFINEKMIKPLAETSEGALEHVLTAINAKQLTRLEKVVDSMTKGNVAFLLENRQECYVIHAPAVNKRAVAEPENERVVRGSHEGFVENLNVNLQLVRRLIASRNLVVRFYELGEETKNRFALVYLHHIADPKLVCEAEHRIRAISAASVLSTNLIEEYIEDRSYSPFPQLLSTERPDRVAGNLLEGRVALLSEGSASAYLFPVTFFAFYQSPDDYYSRSILGTFIRLIRLISFFIAIVLPAYYIAVISFHFEAIPSDVFETIKSGVEKIPFSPIMEALFMELTIELLREASIRLPGRVGQTIGIVGGLVIGDAVVKAGLVSNAMIVVVALTAVASFIVPNHEMSGSLRLLRFPVMIAAAMFGFIGIVVSLMFILIHLCKLESFGTPYFAPLAPFRWKDFKDTLVRSPLWKQNERPLDAHPQSLEREHSSREWQRNDGREK